MTRSSRQGQSGLRGDTYRCNLCSYAVHMHGIDLHGTAYDAVVQLSPLAWTDKRGGASMLPRLTSKASIVWPLM